MTGVFTDYHYFGTGDVGGAPDEDSVKRLEAIVTKGQASLPPPGFISDRPAVAYGLAAHDGGRRAGERDFFGRGPDVPEHYAGRGRPIATVHG